jgi:enamine deaminase RidA (YjgF/YER057c/UK114 family)
MSIERFEKNNMYSNAVIHNETIYISGQYAERNLDSNFELQIKETLENIDRVLSKMGSSKSKLLSTCVYLHDINNFDAMNAQWELWVDSQNPPARATVEAKLADERMQIEISCIAAL